MFVRVINQGKYLITAHASQWVCIRKLPQLVVVGRYFVGGRIVGMDVSYSPERDTIIYCGDLSGSNHLLKVKL